MNLPLKVPFLDVNGSPRSAKALSLLDRKFFQALHQKSNQIAGDRNLLQLYDEDEGFKGIVDTMLLLSGISPAWVDGYLMCGLLYGIGDKPPLLIELNFPSTIKSEEDDDEPQEDLSHFDPDAWAIANLWAATGDIAQALAIAESTPWVWVQEVMRCRAKQITMSQPEEKQKDGTKVAEKAVKKTIESIGVEGIMSRFGAQSDMGSSPDPFSSF